MSSQPGLATRPHTLRDAAAFPAGLAAHAIPPLGPPLGRTLCESPTLSRIRRLSLPAAEGGPRMYLDRIEPCIATQHSKKATTLEIP